MIAEKVWQKVNIEIEGGDKLHDRGAADPGRLTRFGIAQRYHPDIDIVNASEQDIRLYCNQVFWNKGMCDQYSEGKALVVYDTLFMDNGAGAVFIQKAIGAKPDGVIGGQTVARIRMTDLEALIRGVHKQRRAKYLKRNDAVEEANENGWMDRLENIAVSAMAFEYRAFPRTLSGTVGE